MTPTPEQIAAFADGELSGSEAALVAKAVARSPRLQAEVASHKALRARLVAHFAPLLDEPASPAHLHLLRQEDRVVDLAEVRARRRRWAWVAAPALAASIALAVFLRPAATSRDYAQPDLAGMLDKQLISQQRKGAEERVLLSFLTADGRFCRAFSTPNASGIACRDDSGWKIERAASGGQQYGEYRQAASEADVMQQAQDMAAGPALDAAEETKARANGWRSRD
ncbi:anti-sigma factor [Novosphingobium percolationis]|uniref:hypothetical protein n=1 Tax=Novosphingobium percolationis TaxID=2871811 RepID=UPI001CD58902|nr:hypothetical protein [Novosphingobium percolationis]